MVAWLVLLATGKLGAKMTGAGLAVLLAMLVLLTTGKTDENVSGV